MSRFSFFELAPPAGATVRYFRVARRELVYLKFILEAYEGMSTLSTVDRSGGIVRLAIPAGAAPRSGEWPAPRPARWPVP